MDDELVGFGQAEVSSMGPPRTATLRVENNGHVIERKVSRHITGRTVAFGFFSYFTALFWAQHFPERVTMTLPVVKVGWDWAAEENDPWSMPLGKAAVKSRKMDQETKGGWDKPANSAAETNHPRGDAPGVKAPKPKVSEPEASKPEVPAPVLANPDSL
jgi:hypothetical protein